MKQCCLCNRNCHSRSLSSLPLKGPGTSLSLRKLRCPIRKTPLYPLLILPPPIISWKFDRSLLFDHQSFLHSLLELGSVRHTARFPPNPQLGEQQSYQPELQMGRQEGSETCPVPGPTSYLRCLLGAQGVLAPESWLCSGEEKSPICP